MSGILEHTRGSTLKAGRPYLGMPVVPPWEQVVLPHPIQFGDGMFLDLGLGSTDLSSDVGSPQQAAGVHCGAPGAEQLFCGSETV